MRVFGLIGNPLGHSFSPGYFNEKFVRENLPGHQYRLFPIRDVGTLIPLLRKHPEIEGLNVTIPYKREVIGLLDEIDPVAERIGAVNTIKINRPAGEDIYLKGFNTDAVGFKDSCTGLRRNIKAIILGTGGSAQAISFVLNQLQIPFISVSRKPKNKDEIGYNDLNKSVVQNHHLIINTTPLGMFPDVGKSPPFPFQYLSREHFLFDLIYNPAETQFLKMGKLMGASIQNGSLMLELQAERSWEIWNA